MYGGYACMVGDRASASAFGRGTSGGWDVGIALTREAPSEFSEADGVKKSHEKSVTLTSNRKKCTYIS